MNESQREELNYFFVHVFNQILAYEEQALNGMGARDLSVKELHVLLPRVVDGERRLPAPLQRYAHRPAGPAVFAGVVQQDSHELKTPLTVLLADADILLGHPDDTIRSQSRWVEHLRDEGLRMKGLVEDLPSPRPARR